MKGSSFDWKKLSYVDQKLLEAFEQKQFAEVDKLINDGANVNVYFGPGDSALHYFKDVEIIEKLLKCGACVNQTNSYRETPLMHAVSYYKHYDIVKLLLKHGASVSYSKRHGETALSMALHSSFFRQGYPEQIIKVLLEFGDYLKVTELCYPKPISELLIKLSLINRNVCVTRNVIVNSKSEYVEYADKCQAELDLMNSTKLNNSSSLLDIVKNWRQWLPDQTILKFLKDYEQQYPIYADVISDRIVANVSARCKLLSKLDELVVIAEGFELSRIVLNNDCKRYMMKFVSNKDLKSFIEGVTTDADDEKKDLDAPDAKRFKIE